MMDVVVDRAVLLLGAMAGVVLFFAFLALLSLFFGVWHAPTNGPQYFVHCEPAMLPTHIQGWKCW